MGDKERAGFVVGSAQIGDRLEILNSKAPSGHLNCRCAACSSGRAAAQNDAPAAVKGQHGSRPMTMGLAVGTAWGASAE
jgi:hypothetical protein